MPPQTRLHLEPQIIALVRELTAFLAERGITAYATGGFVRDALIGHPARDIDLSIDADPQETGRALADAFAGNFVVLDEERGVVRIILPARGAHVDLQRLRGAIEEDMLLRDYTIDAMATLLSEVGRDEINLIDPLGGRKDAQSRKLRLVGETALLDDPLRLLRGMRLPTQLNLLIEPNTAALIRRHAPLIAQAAPERQRDELVLIFATGRAAAGLRLMDELGLLSATLPELDVTRGVEQPKEHHFDVFQHGVSAVAALDTILSPVRPAEDFDGRVWEELWSQLAWWEGARDYLSEEIGPDLPRTALLKLCALLHDIGKPGTKSFEPSGRMRFFGHADAGADMAVRILRRLRFPNRAVDMVASMIRAHLRPLQMAQTGAPSDRAIYRFFRDTGGAGIDTLILS
ncbi:MAG: HD domain-containing protein, partial [Burkholderiales bacterium]